ncbi:MAG: bifunctional [glutamate--ammonia ligase]-adenylyl-L-tyrosine phosphorylase/[glutamate--ammonia-ligase] adenylyltransferase [Xanthomonadales bacterium]|jgi:glutamate-ammonia-ligase adenylyltransferase|nr:bifunctional [glutamate--ammonia ligase]-adenylyl-L-tyrosine phosphorylase/[glutamate--ammonia-ligase] adenylyltransferase [Xanthomonadales bacterium]
MAKHDPSRALALSPFLEDLDRRYPEWLPSLEAEGRLRSHRPPSAADLEDAVAEHGLDRGLRRFRNREMLCITWREITGTASLEATLGDLTRLAELCLDTAVSTHHAALVERFGTPRDGDGKEQSLVVLGLGKLGGGELNLSSDIDLILCFPENGACDGRRGLANETFFTRLARAVIGSLAERTGDGFCFRVDTRLRPFGESGPLVCSFKALEHYYQREGRDWERYALVKARPVAGDREAGQALVDILRPFVYRRYIDFGAVESLREMLDAIQADAARRKGRGDVKRGPGGIREVEFGVQCIQLLRGGREPALQTPSLLDALSTIQALDLLPGDRVAALREAYGVLRRVENAIQALHDQQTHELPQGEDLDRVVRILCQPDRESFQTLLESTRQTVTDALDASFPRQAGNEEPGTWEGTLELAGDDAWRALLRRIRRVGLTRRGHQRLDAFMKRLFQRLETGPRNAAVEDDLRALVNAISRRSAYLALLVQNPPALDRMLELFNRSDWIARTVTRHPALLDELIDPALGRTLPDRAELSESARRLARGDDEEQAINALNTIKLAQSLRIATAELEGVLSSVEAETRLTALAEVLLERCLKLAEQAVARRHGHLEPNGLALIGYGSLGGGDISYGSDLDLVFLYPDGQGESDGPRPLAAETWYTRCVRRLLALATTQTPAGRLYEIDTRLRPNGRSGLLVSPLDAFARYQAEKAWVWEWQALTRARPVAGDADVSARFQAIREAVLAQPKDSEALRREIPAMRQKMRAQGGGDPFKQVPGGLLDIDFVAQLGILERAPEDPALRGLTRTTEQLQALAAHGWLEPDDAELLMETYRALTRARHLRALLREDASLLGETRPDTTAARDVCARFGLSDAADLAKSR